MSLTKNKYLSPIISRIFVAKTYTINAINAGIDNNHKVIDFKVGHSWVEIYKTPKDTHFDESVKTSPAGKLFDQKLSLYFPGDDESNITDFEELEGQPLCVRFEYDNGKSRFFGALDNPAFISINYSTKSGGASILFDCTSKFRAFWI